MTNQSKIMNYFLNKIDMVRQKIDLLPKDGPIRTALSYDKLTDISKQIYESEDNDLRIATWEPLFLFLADHSLIEIQEFETDINLVLYNSQQAQLPNVVQFLREKDDRKWAGGIFEIFIKSRFLKAKDDGIIDEVWIDFILGNGRIIDIRLKIGDMYYCLECTVLSDSDEEREAFKKWSEAGGRGSIMDYFIKNSKAPSLNYNCNRFYTKIYDKLTDELDTQKSQLCDDSANLVMISFYTPYTPFEATSLEVGWALDELFINQPSYKKGLKDNEKGDGDPSLIAWIDYTIMDICSKNLPDREKSTQAYKNCCDDYDQIVSSPRKIGGILIFNRCELKHSRVNYNANKLNKISHEEIAKYEELLRRPPIYCL